MKYKTKSLSTGNWIIIEYKNPIENRYNDIISEISELFEECYLLGETCLCFDIKNKTKNYIEKLLGEKYKCERFSIISINEKIIYSYPDFEIEN